MKNLTQPLHKSAEETALESYERQVAIIEKQTKQILAALPIHDRNHSQIGGKTWQDAQALLDISIRLAAIVETLNK